MVLTMSENKSDDRIAKCCYVLSLFQILSFKSWIALYTGYVLLVFSVKPFKKDQYKNQNLSID